MACDLTIAAPERDHDETKGANMTGDRWMSAGTVKILPVLRMRDNSRESGRNVFLLVGLSIENVTIALTSV